jgi:nucleoside-diphosphate-sugar epimerase
MNSVIREDYASLARRLADQVQSFAGAHVLVTGAAGFIGRYLCGFFDYLNSHVLDRPLTADLLDSFVVGHEPNLLPGTTLRPRFGDVSKRVQLSASPDYIVHAAGVASPKHYARRPVQTLEAGTTGTRRMLDLARRCGCRGMLFFSSSEIYGNPDPQHVPTKETYNGNVSTSGPRACYDESKRLGETWSFLYAREHQVHVKVVRLFNVYGPGFDRGDGRVVPSFIESAATGCPLVVHGRGQHTRTFCYIADACDALLRVLLAERAGEAFNIGADGPELSMGELAALIASLTSTSAPVVYREPEESAYAHDNPGRRCPDISKLRAATGFRPLYSLDAGLARTLAWFAEEYGVPLDADGLTLERI